MRLTVEIPDNTDVDGAAKLFLELKRLTHYQGMMSWRSKEPCPFVTLVGIRGGYDPENEGCDPNPECPGELFNAWVEAESHEMDLVVAFCRGGSAKIQGPDSDEAGERIGSWLDGAEAVVRCLLKHAFGSTLYDIPDSDFKRISASVDLICAAHQEGRPTEAIQK